MNYVIPFPIINSSSYYSSAAVDNFGEFAAFNISN